MPHKIGFFFSATLTRSTAELLGIPDVVSGGARHPFPSQFDLTILEVPVSAKAGWASEFRGRYLHLKALGHIFPAGRVVRSHRYSGRSLGIRSQRELSLALIQVCADDIARHRIHGVRERVSFRVAELVRQVDGLVAPSHGQRQPHSTVTITEITLDGEDATHLLTRLNSGAFELLAHNPGESHHDVEYTAEDDAGNHEHFDVHVHPLGAEEPPYEVQLSPGWNLISLPGTPERPALSDVVPSRGLVTPVLSYQDGDWHTAILDDGVWRGRLQEIVGGYGYWMFSIAAETIAVDIPDQERREKLPSVPVTHGWNLLGVMDLLRNEQGEPPGPKDGGGGETDHYFATIPWVMAYTFDTPRSRWVRLIPRDDETGAADGEEPPEIVNGRGYWVWSEEPSTLVP